MTHTTVVSRRYLDELMDDYVSWREACRALADAYDKWKHARREDEKLAFGTYVAALDREQKAAGLYQESVERVAAAHPA